MKKEILCIGKFNSVSQDMQNYLSEYFRVHTCSDDCMLEMGIWSMYRPDLVLVSLIDMDKSNNKILEELKSNYPQIPILCIGNEKEQENFSTFFQEQQFQPLTRPISNQDILSHIYKQIGTSSEDTTERGRTEYSGRKHILLIDDNAVQLRALRGILKDKFDVSMATSAMEAMVIIGKKCPDLIFLDYEMPVCDGKMTFETIKKVEEAKDIPVVFLTGVDDREHIQAVLRLKPAGYLLKPVEQKRIFEIIHEVLGD